MLYMYNHINIGNLIHFHLLRAKIMVITCQMTELKLPAQLVVT